MPPSITRPGQVCAVVVTFNRKKLLEELLTALPQQVRRPDCTVVIDNASTDGTHEMVARDFPGVTFIQLGKNTGGAGGFRAGMQWAYEQGYEWIWIMDDDIEPYPEALERLLSFTQLSNFIHLRRDNIDNWEGIWDPHTFTIQLYPREYSFENGKPYIYVNYACFEGPLIHWSIIDRIGPGDDRYFVSADDAVYGFQASFHTNILYVNQRGFRRKLPGADKFSRMSAYLSIRNKFLVYDVLRERGISLARRWFWFYQIRLAFYLIQQLSSHHQTRNWTCFRAVWEGLRDGRNSVFGPPPWLRPKN